MSFVKILEYMAGIMSRNTHLKGVLGFRYVFDLDFLFIVDIWHDVQKRSESTLISIFPKYLQYLQPVLTLWTCVLIFDAIILKKCYFLGICFCGFDFTFVKKMYVFYVRCAVMSPHSVHYHWIKLRKTLYEKGR